MQVLLVEIGENPRILEIDGSLDSMQKIVCGHLEAIYPYKDQVAIVCNEEGNLNGLPLNRTIYDSEGNYIDVIAGTFFMIGLGEEDFIDFPAKLFNKYSSLFMQQKSFIFSQIVRDCL